MMRAAWLYGVKRDVGWFIVSSEISRIVKTKTGRKRIFNAQFVAVIVSVEDYQELISIVGDHGSLGIEVGVAVGTEIADALLRPLEAASTGDFASIDFPLADSHAGQDMVA